MNWNAVGALASVAAVGLTLLGVLSRWVVSEIRQNRQISDAINRRVTTPDSVPGTLGETVAQMSLEIDAHDKADDSRFKKIWHELGKPEPQ